MRIPLLSIVITIFFTLLTDWYIWADVRYYSRKSRNPRRWPMIYAVSAVICWIYITVVLLLPRRGESSIIHVMWLLYAYLTIYVPKFIYLIFSLIGRIRFGKRKKRNGIGTYVGLPVAAIVFGLMWWGALVTRNQTNINRVEITSANLPAGFDGFKIVQFSDAHTGTWGNDTSFVSRMVDSINALNPDLIVFTGDLVNRRSEEAIPFMPALSRLKATHGVISVLGNHDYGDYMNWPSEDAKMNNRQALCMMQKQMGWTLLNNENIRLRQRIDSIVVIGVENWGEPPFHQYGDLKKSYPQLNDSCFKLLLSHNPEHWRLEVTKKSNIDLTLSGHTHAMQMMVSAGNHKWSPASWRYKQWAGLYEATNPANTSMQLYVNIGAGTVGLPFRIGATPEITLLTLRKKK